MQSYSVHFTPKGRKMTSITVDADGQFEAVAAASAKYKAPVDDEGKAIPVTIDVTDIQE